MKIKDRKRMSGMKDLIKWWIILAALVLLQSGCITTFAAKKDKKAIMKAYLEEVSKFDGINRQEAILIAQSEVIFRGYDEKYYVDEPQLWFEDEQKYSIRFYRISNKTLQVIHPKDSLLVEVAKKDGKVTLEIQ